MDTTVDFAYTVTFVWDYATMTTTVNVEDKDSAFVAAIDLIHFQYGLPYTLLSSANEVMVELAG